MANRNNRSVFLWLTAVLTTLWLGAASPSLSWSQPPAPAPPLNDGTASAVPNALVTAPAQPVVVRGPCDPDYWIVSTRCCKEAAECCQPCHYHVYRFDGPNPGREASLDEMLASLQPAVPVCFMAHGSFVEWDSMLQDSANTYRWLRRAAPDRPVQMVFFTWPSDDTSRLIPHCEVNRLGRRATLHGLYLADLVSRIPPDHPISLIGHSHGARMICAALQALSGGDVEGRWLAGGSDNLHRIRAVFAAAAMDHDWFNPGQRFDRALCRTEGVLNLRNRHDVALLAYPVRRPFSSRALAITGLTRSDEQKLGDAGCRIADCDVTHLVECRHIWQHYYRHPEIACAIRHYVYFDE